MIISLSQIKPSPRAIRKTWDEEGLDQLAQSIKESGLIVPIKVRPADGDKYEVVYGHRRVKAMRRAGIVEAEAIVEGVDDTSVVIQALIENVQREDMTPIDIAGALFLIQEETGWSPATMADKGVMPERTIQRYMALLRENARVQELVDRYEPGGVSSTRMPKGKVTVTHIDQVRESGLSGQNRIAVIEKAAEEGLTADQTRRVAEAVKAARVPEQKQHLIETPFSSLLHDPDVVRERPRMPRKPTADLDWSVYPSTVAIIDHLRRWHKRIPDFRASDEIGKLPAEAGRFLAREARKTAEALLEWAGELEKRHGP